MNSGQELPGLFERPGTPKGRNRRDNDDDYDSDSDRGELAPDDENDYGDYDPDDEQYEQGRTNRENFGQVMRTIADRIKHLF